MVTRTKVLSILSAIVLGIIFSYSCRNLHKAGAHSQTNIYDTSFLKSIRWDSLNTFVDYHIVNEGEPASDARSRFAVKLFAIYYYPYNFYEQVSKDTILQLSKAELKIFLQSDSFSDRRNFDCLLKINSQIGYQYKPDMLKRVVVRPKDTSSKGIKALINDLKKESFVQTITTGSVERIDFGSLGDRNGKTTFIDIKLAMDSPTREKTKEICKQLKTRPDIQDATFPDVLAGVNEMQLFYRLTSIDDVK
jgi:hypothetical protein